MMLTFRADMHIVLKLLEEDHGLAFFAFVPEVIGRLALGDRRDLVADVAEPRHVLVPQNF
ncbi:MAG: hypothetical protein Pars2KO_18250 [Parasphingorhabdus sp.]